LEKAVAALIAEPFDNNSRPAARPQPSASQPDATFPEVKGSVANATDIRGKRAPEFFVQEWVSRKPEPAGKVVMIDFWATWCGPCVQSIPHLNELAKQFGDRLVIVGISSETSKAFEQGAEKAKLEPESFAYSVALDSGKKMENAIKVTAIPHGIVMSRDWIVRWQGDPRRLTADILEQIIQADQAAAAGASDKSKGKRRGWRSAGGPSGSADER
jgi:cytochrome c biogenesis protein CcmG/thiol:disulfide interchange protein DsbE